MVATIEYIENVIRRMEEATRLNERDPARSGSVIELTDDEADDVMITADLHGNRRNFNQIKKIADLENHPRRHLVMQEVCHGGPAYPTNGGCMSHGMLEDVSRMIVEYPGRVHFLLSNHEWAEVTDYPILKSQRMLNLAFRLGMQEMYGPATEKVRESYLPFLRSCPLAVRLPGGVFVCHTAPEKVDEEGFDASVFDESPGELDLSEHGEVYRLLWGRDYRPENAEAFARLVKAKVLIHGHEPCPQGFNVPNAVQIILDCCHQPACYLIVPAGQEFTQAELVERIQKIP